MHVDNVGNNGKSGKNRKKKKILKFLKKNENNNNDQIQAIDFCPTCVSFVGQTLGELLNIIANIGVVTGCTELCSYLEETVEVSICDALCSAVGVAAFIKLVETMKSNPDAIYFCKELSVCPDRVGAATINSLVISPVQGKLGISFNATGSYNVSKETGTGQLVLTINQGTSNTVLHSHLIENLAAKQYLINFFDWY